MSKRAIPRAVIIDDDAQRAVRLRLAPALARLSPVTVTWGPQVAPLLQFLEPEVVVAATPDMTPATPQLEMLRSWSATRSFVVHGPVTASPAHVHLTGAIAVACEDERARTLARTLVRTLAPEGPAEAGAGNGGVTRSSTVLQIGDAVVDMARGEVVRDNERATLGPRERGLLGALARRNGAVVSRTTLVAEVWRDNAPGSRVVDRLVYALRRRLERDPADPKHVLTVFARGYRLVT